ncbi:MAG: 7-cyano-7-deazaguanine synthase [Pseudomonadota bacterium]|nr:7-cyano-7-deazaguanine synthase [Patescibacteria group bacterium]
MKRSAVVLLSGGLDSTLAVKMMVEQGIELTAIHFTSPFCNCSPHKAGCRNQARKVAAEFGVPIQVIVKGMDYMRIVEKPPHGHGRGMNPCIDCRIYMLRKVAGMMDEIGASFVITGEVLGQRPMSQHRQAIELIERESGLAGRILRPLSAHHFPPTLPEEEGIVDRGRLLAISGRSRKEQIALAEELGIRDYPCPAGGCLLTDPDIAGRLRDLFAHVPGYAHRDLVLLNIGRHFRLSPRLRIILGRSQEENEKLVALAAPGDVVFTPENFRGPTALALGESDPATEGTIGEMIPAYSQDDLGTCLIRKEVIGGESLTFTGPGKRMRDTFVPLRIGRD